tara:strand:+ start:15563 stop:16063 length:501 start_codon:yes stop_codon:yes gene_type:complete
MQLDYYNISEIVGNLSIFLLIIGGNFIGDIFSNDLIKLLKNNLIIKHIAGFFIMLFFIGFIQKNISFKDKILNSSILYILYILIMNTYIYGTLFIIICISLLYINNLYIRDLEKTLSINKEISDELNNKIQFNKNINIIILLFTILGIIFGLIFNINKKKLITRFR